MILDVEQTTICEVSHHDMMMYCPLNLARMALFNIQDIIKEAKHEPLEWFTFDKIETPHKIVGIKSRGIENWQ